MKTDEMPGGQNKAFQLLQSEKTGKFSSPKILVSIKFDKLP